MERKRAEEAARAAAAKAAAAAAAKARAENRPVPAAPVAKPKESSGGYMAATPEAARLSAAFESNRGSLPWPVAAGSITESFGKHKEGQASYDNAGVTIQTAEGAGVRAVFNGKVTKVGNALGRYYILIKHGQFFTVYQNLRSVSVSAGDDVTTKQNIQYSGLRTEDSLKKVKSLENATVVFALIMGMFTCLIRLQKSHLLQPVHKLLLYH